jgi:hypothetical protein
MCGGTTSKYLRCTTSGAAGNGLGTTINYLRGAVSVGLGTTVKYLRRSTSCAAGNGLDTTINYLRGAAGIGLSTTAKYLGRTTSGDQVPAAHYERSRGQWPGATIKYL